MTSTHESILAELYEIDPSLREHEAELVPLLQKLLTNDPAQKPNAAFVKKLRTELAARMNAMANGAVEHRVSYTAPSSFFNRFAYAFAGAVAAVIIAVPVTMKFMESELTDEAAGTQLTGNDALGMERPTMPLPNTGVIAAGEAEGTPTMVARGQGGGGGGIAMDGNVSAVSSLIAPWNPVKYRLEGDLPELPTGNVTVLERTLHPMNVPFSSIQNAFNDASIDLTSFDNTSVESVSIVQRKPFGYTINVSLADGSVSINQQWDQWPHPEQDCRDEACYRSMQPNISDIPSDGELFRIADAFLDDHKIDLSGYGDPIVDTAWRDQYNAMEDKRYAWVPDSIRIIYPLMVDSMVVNEAMGEPSGISVQVSIKHKRVSDVWGLTTYQFNRKDHPAVSERSDIEEFLSLAGSQTPDAPTVVLSNPTKGYVRLYTYENNKNSELFVPALIFTITGAPDGMGYLPRTVAVPLAKDLLDEAAPPMPMPYEGEQPLMMENAAN